MDCFFPRKLRRSRYVNVACRLHFLSQGHECGHWFRFKSKVQCRKSPSTVRWICQNTKLLSSAVLQRSGKKKKNPPAKHSNKHEHACAARTNRFGQIKHQVFWGKKWQPTCRPTPAGRDSACSSPVLPFTCLPACCAEFSKCIVAPQGLGSV